MSDRSTQHGALPGTDLSLLGEAHVRVYRESNGERGYFWNGVPTLLLTTTGRKSGAPRTIPIIYTPYGEGFVIIASKGGAPTHPQWYLNLLANPHAEVQVKARTLRVRARTAESPEREQLWTQATKTWPNYDVYQTRTTRRIPVVVLEPI